MRAAGGGGQSRQGVGHFHRHASGGKVGTRTDGPVLVEVGGDGGGGGGLDVGRRGEVREALGEVDGADALRQVGQLLDG